MKYDDIKEITNKQRHEFYKNMAIFVYEVAVKVHGTTKDVNELEKQREDLEIAAAEIKREGGKVPEDLHSVSRSENHYRKIANQYGGSWLLVEVVTEHNIKHFDRATEQSEFVEICKRVAEVNRVFLATALDLKMNAEGELI